uniref:uS12 prolyl 3-hydroxylase n=1 Tax=Daphnia galeata TaxID=27404 RepID=A0A8J2RRY3_9CRUS|nr:unnamed protein product [Daphnia galeata]
MNPAKKFKGKHLQTKSAQSNRQWQVTDLVQPQFNSKYSTEEFLRAAADAWSLTEKQDKQVQIAETKCLVYKYPFNCCQLRNFVDDDSFLHQLKHELLSLNFHEKSNDLYKFHQSQDLKKVTTAAVSALKKFLYSDFRQWLIQVTGIELNSTVDMSCARYNHTDVLLCHDDELEGRRIAYILYLVDEDWTSADGGNLDLYTVDERKQPDRIVTSLVPVWNSLAFFSVTPTSFHQVSEILAASSNKCRLSVSGWFHGKPFKRPPTYIEPVKYLSKPEDMDEDDFYTWISPAYLDPSTQGDVQSTFSDKSEIQLQEFIQPDKYGQLCEALHSLQASDWITQGPANKRNYECSESTSLVVLNEARKFFHSEAFFLVLSNLTGLKLHRLASTPSSSENESSSDEKPSNGTSKSKKGSSSDIDPCCRLQVSRWQTGCYTMLSDEDAHGSEYALDVWFFLSADHWQLPHGGQVSYIARGEDEELLTICPSNNCLALVYRDQDTMRFVKHINSLSGDLKHFTINGVYYDRPPNRE